MKPPLTCRPSVSYVPKYERLKQFIQRYPAEVVDAEALEGYVALMSAAAEFTNEATRRLAAYGLADARTYILALLLHHEPAELTHSELSELMGVTKGNITGLINGLERSGYVKRGDRDTDRRVMPIALTASGRHLIEKALREHFSSVAAHMKVLSAAEQKQLVTILSKIRTHLATAQPTG